MTYTVIHRNVDGAGVIGTYRTMGEAQQVADELQAKSDSRGNPYCYTYHVFEGCYGGRQVYETRCMVRCINARSVEIGGNWYRIEEFHLYGPDGLLRETFCMVDHRDWPRAERFATVAEAINRINTSVLQPA